jgi:hypothetical protein
MRTLLLSFVAATAMAQIAGLSLPPSGDNQRSTVSQTVGPVKLTLEYSSPAVKDRRGQIWGKLVPYGLTNLGFGHGKPSPWRAGANENTVFETSHEVLVEGKPLPAGRYGLHMIAGAEEWTLIFSKNSQSWGSFFYEPKDDALRVTVKPAKHDFREWLTYEFVTRKPTEARIEMQWEELAVGWAVRVPNVNEVYLSRLRKDLGNVAGFNWNGYVGAVNFCLQNKVNLEEALQWSELAIAMPFVGQKNFVTLTTKSQVLSALGREAEARQIMLSAIELPGTSPLQIHQLGRQILASGKAKDALEIFTLNQKRHGDTWPVHVGMARGLAATGDKKAALEHAKKALAQAPDEINRKGLTDMIRDLSAN